MSNTKFAQMSFKKSADSNSRKNNELEIQRCLLPIQVQMESFYSSVIHRFSQRKEGSRTIEKM